MMRRKLTRSGIRPVIAGLAVIVALLGASVPVASAHQGHSGAPGHPPGRHAAHHPGHGGHAGAPGR
jgi:hypothetical protein